MNWNDFYERFYDWSESTQRARIYSLTDMGPSAEVTEIACAASDVKLADCLINRALNKQVSFSAVQIIDLLDYVSTKLARRLLLSCPVIFTNEQLDELETYLFDDDFVNTIRLSSLLQNPGQISPSVLSAATNAFDTDALNLIARVLPLSLAHQAILNDHLCDFADEGQACLLIRLSSTPLPIDQELWKNLLDNTSQAVKETALEAARNNHNEKAEQRLTQVLTANRTAHKSTVLPFVITMLAIDQILLDLTRYQKRRHRQKKRIRSGLHR